MKAKFSEEYIEKRNKWTQECRGLIHKADYALTNNSKRFTILHKEAVVEMKKLLTKTSGQGMNLFAKLALKNEFYFQTKQYKFQYHLGKKYFERHGEKRFLYSAFWSRRC